MAPGNTYESERSKWLKHEAKNLGIRLTYDNKTTGRRTPKSNSRLNREIRAELKWRRVNTTAGGSTLTNQKMSKYWNRGYKPYNQAVNQNKVAWMRRQIEKAISESSNLRRAGNRYENENSELYRRMMKGNIEYISNMKKELNKLNKMKKTKKAKKTG